MPAFNVKIKNDGSFRFNKITFNIPELKEHSGRMVTVIPKAFKSGPVLEIYNRGMVLITVVKLLNPKLGKKPHNKTEQKVETEEKTRNRVLFKPRKSLKEVAVKTVDKIKNFFRKRG